MKDWYIYSFADQCHVAETLQEVYEFFSKECGVDEEWNEDIFGVIKVQSTNKPKLQHIKVTHTLKLV